MDRMVGESSQEERPGNYNPMSEFPDFQYFPMTRTVCLPGSICQCYPTNHNFGAV
jgi:hypothetical protein